jgi:hypothetical protein
MFQSFKFSSLARKLVIVSLAFAVTGCAVWTRVDEKTTLQTDPNGKYKIEAPAGWVRLSILNTSVMITRDGIPIQHINIGQYKEDDFFKETKVKLPPNVLPSDLAQMVLAEMRANKELANLVVKQNVPHVVAGQPGFKVHFQYRNDRGTVFDRVVLGTAKGKEVITMVYHGLNNHYFARDLQTFYKVAESFKT